MTSRQFSICHLNIRSLAKHYDEVILNDFIFAKNSIICFSETWLNDSHPNSKFSVPSFNFIRKDRKSISRGGGLAIYINNNLQYRLLSTPTSEVVESLLLKISTSAGGLCLLLVYCPPGRAGSLLSFFEELFDGTTLGVSNTIVIGDFNVDWLKNSTHKANISDMMSLHNFTQLVSEPTRVTDNSSTLIDLLFSDS
jgi:hypothetical protein